MKLVIANKAYSSWSLRPWMLLTVFGIPFEEDIIPLDTPEFRSRVAAYKAGSTVPILIDGDVTVWESLAIMDYVADRFPDKAVWPRDIKARAFARTISAEMHAGFRGLRAACPMNVRKRYATRDRGDLVSNDVARVKHLWTQARERFGAKAGGAFPFRRLHGGRRHVCPGRDALADLRHTGRGSHPAYMDAVLDHPAFLAWHEAAMKESWVVAHDEADEPAIGPFR